MQAVASAGRLPKIVVVVVALGIVAVGAATLLRSGQGRSDSAAPRVSEGSKDGGNWVRAGAGDPGKWSGAEEGEVVPLNVGVAKFKAGLGKADSHVPTPAYLPAGATYAQTFYTPAARNRTERVEFRYSTGLWIMMIQQADGFDAWAMADYLNSPKQMKSAMGDNPTPWLRVEVNGIQAMAHESGTETVDGVTARTIPANVSWWKDGIKYDLYDLSGRPVSELVKVAESLK